MFQEKMSLGMAGNYPFREPFANNERSQNAARMQLERSQNAFKMQMQRNQYSSRMQLEMKLVAK